MNRSPSVLPRLAALALAAACSLGQAQTAAPAAPAASAPTLRAEVAKPLLAAQEALKAGNGKEALARATEAEAVASPSPYEAYMTQRLKGQAALAAGDRPAALVALDKAASNPAMPAGERLPVIGLVAQLAYEAKDYARSVTWLRRHAEAGGNDEKLRPLLPQALYLAGDAKGAVEALLPVLQADEAAGRATPEMTLRLLASAQTQAGDAAGYVRTVERLAQAYPKPELWNELIVREARKPGFADKLMLDVYRFRLAVGVKLEADEVADMAQQAQLAGLPGEARDALDAAAAAGLALPPEAQKLRQQATAAAAKDVTTLADGEANARKAAGAQPLFNVGRAYVNYGQADKGAALMAQAVAKGGLRNADEAQMQLGYAQWKAGRNAEAIAAFEAVKAADGSAGLARLWALWLKSAKR